MTAARSSLAWSEMALTDATIEPSAGVDEASDGAVLSIRIAERTLARELPKLSNATARRS